VVTVVSLAVLLVGLVLGVFAMLYGTERSVRADANLLPHQRTSEHVPAAEPSPLLNLASVGAFSVGFGLTGYLVAHRTTWPIAAQVVVAAVAGALAMGLQSLLIARWAIPAARADHVDERYVLQGTLGRVLQEIPAHGEGVVRYALDEREFDLPARDIDGDHIAVGSDVVIDRVEHGVAVVELWARVEQRL
jgi:hypothetical protein